MGAKTREARGHGAAHKALRERVRVLIDSGSVVLCARCRRRTLAGEPWDLDHGPDRSSYLGPSHRRCNRLAGARKGAAVTHARHATQPAPMRRRSQNWNAPDPPPPDVVILGGD